MRRTGLVATCLGALLGCAVWLTTRPSPATAAESEVVRVVFEDPIPSSKPKPTGKDKEACTTSCSLAKHHIDPFTAADYERTLAEYASSDAEEPGQALEKLLFYGLDTKRYIVDYGTEGLPDTHLQVLQRELARDHALVSLRLVDEAGRTRVSYGPESVPIGQKQHLTVVGEELQAMEFNGTVMRTGVNYLWSRY